MISYEHKHRLIESIYMYLWGVFKSTFVDFNIRSTDDWLSKGGRGEGSLSNDHILFLANPCCSSEPRSPNWNRNSIKNVGLQQQKSNMFSPPVWWNETNPCKASWYSSFDCFMLFPVSLFNRKSPFALTMHKSIASKGNNIQKNAWNSFSHPYFLVRNFK